MRKLNRKKVTVPDILVKRDAAGPLETAAAIAYYGSKVRPAGTRGVKYKAYGHATVKKAVSRLSFDKMNS